MDVCAGLFDLVEESGEAVGGKNLLGVALSETFANHTQQFLGHGIGCCVSAAVDGDCASHSADVWAESAEQYTYVGLV